MRQMICLFACIAAGCHNEVVLGDLDAEVVARCTGIFAGAETGVIANAFYLQEETARALRRGRQDLPVLEELLTEATAAGVGVIRTHAFNDDPNKVGESAIQVGKLEFDAISLTALDHILARAHEHGLQLILTLGNYWNDYGGTRQYVRWANLSDPREGDPRFFTERVVIDHYKDYVSMLLTRQSTVDGLRYADHPAVFAWELLNEPRGGGPHGLDLDREGDALSTWVGEMAVHVRSLTSQPVTVGDEGLDTTSVGYQDAYWREVAPGWLFNSGGSFRRYLDAPQITFASTHFYPEAWGLLPEEIATAGLVWMRDHASLASERGKQLLFSEFGLTNDGAFTLTQRRQIYAAWFDCAKRLGIAGVGPWLWATDDRPERWDPYTFYWHNGTSADAPQNRYLDLIRDVGGGS